MFDVFYIGKKPGLFSFEKPADSIEHARQQSRTRYCWVVNYLCDYRAWDWLWEPVPWEAAQRHAWPSQWSKDSGTYLIPKPGFSETNYRKDRVIRCNKLTDHWDSLTFADFDYTWHPDPTDPPYIYQFGTQWQKTGGPRYVVPGATEVKYVPLPRAVRAKVDDYWQQPEGGEFGDFDYTWHPDDTEQPYIYQFGTQWQKTGGPRYVVPGATEVKYVEQVKIESRRVADRVFLLDHLDGNIECVRAQLETRFETVQVVRYFDNYLDTLRRIANTAGSTRGFAWVCSSVCDYSNFDFSWHPEQWQANMLHVFASEEQKFGDTFFIHPGTFAERSRTCQLLDWYDVNYVADITVPRWSLPVIRHNHDTHVAAVKTMDWPGPLAVFTVDQAPAEIPTVSLWREKTKTVVPLNPGASSVIVPKTAVSSVCVQMYDYEHIDKTHMYNRNEQPLDVVFISNGEVNADQHWQKTTETVNGSNRVVRVNGVNGRVAAYCAAAEASQTPWFFAVFAKLEVAAGFDWSWQPDRLQQPKHYIFHAHNPVTGLEYGHMAMIAYNKQLVLQNSAPGLDFTLDQEHEVVPILSGVAHYHDSAWMAWRTAFRECIKLRYSLPDVENEYRLQAWLDNNLVETENGEWSRRGAADAIEYYDSVGGDFVELRRSYDWAWLADYAFMQRGLTTDQ